MSAYGTKRTSRAGLAKFYSLG